MCKCKTGLSLLLALFMFTIATAQPQSGKRIRFQRYRSSASVSGTVQDKPVVYLVGAKAGQHMKIEITKGAAFRLFTPVGEPLQGGKGVVVAKEDLDETGDYRIEVEKISGTRVSNFSLIVSID
jgi:hypothetical protein